jgi:hypothetical protein
MSIDLFRMRSLTASWSHWLFALPRFERQAIVDTKRLVDVASLPPEAEMQPIWDAFIASVGRPATQARLKALIDKGLQTPGDLERNLGRATTGYRK